MYFIVSVTNNYALNFNISMPLHMIFRAVRRLHGLFLFCLRAAVPKVQETSDQISMYSSRDP